LSHLDPLTAREVVSWLDALQKVYDWTVIVVEHRLDAWRDFFDRGLRVVNGGFVEQVDCAVASPILFNKRRSSMASATVFDMQIIDTINQIPNIHSYAIGPIKPAQILPTWTNNK